MKDHRGRHKKDYIPQTEEERLKLEVATLKRQLYLAQMENDVLKKIAGAGEGESLSLTRLLTRYQTVKILHEEKGYSIQDLCPLVHIARSSYYKWLNHPKSQHELENEKVSAAIQQIYTEHPDKSHRRIRDDLEKDYGILTSK